MTSEKKEEADKSIKRSIVIEIAKQLYINHAMPAHDYKELAWWCFNVAEIWTDEQIAYCEKNET